MRQRKNLSPWQELMTFRTLVRCTNHWADSRPAGTYTRFTCDMCPRISNVEILICMMYVCMYTCMTGVRKVLGSIPVRDSLSHVRDMLTTSFHISSLSSKFTIFLSLNHALGKVTKKLGQWIGKLGIMVRIGLLQKTTCMLLGTARILRWVLEF